mgnify:CR=1 FL=1|tara:strand:- start:9626 stop:10894 length:1269 start_codon:yes stop_codon:yes gene_type:complete
MKKYEWAVIGSGIAGVSIAEILTREGHSVILIEKNKTLASETTRDFHEWLHTGALYTLIPDRLKTLRFILGAIDDLIEYYSSFKRMNLIPTSAGLKIDTTEKGWFDDNYIHFKYKVKGRKITFPWLYGIARSIFLIERIHKHDWLRRRAGEMRHYSRGRGKRIRKIFKELLFSNEVFRTFKTSDFTINSRLLLNDMISTALANGLEISTFNNISKIDKSNKHLHLLGSKKNIIAENVVLCNGAGIERFSNVKTKTSFAPIAVVSGLKADERSFVELDYFTKNCINLLTKEKGIGLIGGISLSEEAKCDEYIDYVIKKHKELNPDLIELHRYNGIKSEITFNKEPRGYLYHIVNSEKKIWAIIPGKFTLAFSMAPEFYRRVYDKNPMKNFQTDSNGKSLEFLSNTVWKDIYNLSKGENNYGND